MNDHQYWLGLSLIPQLGSKRIIQLWQHFGDLSLVWQANSRDLRAAGLPQNLSEAIVTHRPQIDTSYELARVHKVDAYIVTIADNDYPQRLQKIDDPPALLYMRGHVMESDNRALCIVGTRKMTNYGEMATYRIAKELALNGITIVSGLAQGVDTMAHRGALDAGGRTIGIMGTGIDKVYPSQNTALAREIITQGAVITEYPLRTPPRGSNFPRRNRIMSGLSLGVFITEAGEKSGALITAGTATEQGRDVFALPNNIYNPSGQGANKLIQDGAKLVMSAQDILEEIDNTYDWIETREQTEVIAPTDPTERTIFECLSHDPIHVDDIVRVSGLAIAVVSSTLILLELKGLARNVGNMQYTVSHSPD